MKYMATIVLMGLVLACGNNKQQPTAPLGSNATQQSAATGVDATGMTIASLTCTINGRQWQGSSSINGQLYYAKGITGMYNNLPYMTLSFKSTDAPDNRQLTISFNNFQGKTGVYAKEKIEVLLSGAASGEAQKAEMQGHKPPLQSTDFSVELTEWKATRADEAIVSGKLSGTLKGLMGSPDSKIENGSFANIAVKVFNEKY